jgi:hypothetical protein
MTPYYSERPHTNVLLLFPNRLMFVERTVEIPSTAARTIRCLS